MEKIPNVEEQLTYLQLVNKILQTQEDILDYLSGIKTDKPSKIDNFSLNRSAVPQVETDLTYYDKIKRTIRQVNEIIDVLDSGSGSGYILPVATETKLGGVKAGAKTDEDTTEVHIGPDAKLYTKSSGGSYTLPVATQDALGGVKASPKTTEETVEVKIGADSKLYTKAGGGSYTLPVADSSTLGGVKADTKTEEDTQSVKIGADNKLYVKPSGGEYTLPVATDFMLGGVMADVKGIEDTIPVHIGEDNHLYVSPNTDVPVATSNAIGGIKADLARQAGTPVEIFTDAKLYVDIPQASDTGYGTVIGRTKTADDTVQVSIDNEGKMYVPASGGSEYVLPVATQDSLGGIKALVKTDLETVEVKIDHLSQKLFVNTTPVADSVGTTEIKNSSITNAKLGADCVKISNIADNAVGEAQLAGSAVKQRNIADGVIKADQLSFEDSQVVNSTLGMSQVGYKKSIGQMILWDPTKVTAGVLTFELTLQLKANASMLSQYMAQAIYNPKLILLSIDKTKRVPLPLFVKKAGALVDESMYYYYYRNPSSSYLPTGTKAAQPNEVRFTFKISTDLLTELGYAEGVNCKSVLMYDSCGGWYCDTQYT